MKNSEYWEDRIANEVWAKYNSLEEKNAAILNMYRDAEKNMIAEISKLESRGGDLSRSQKYRINHLKSLKNEINAICEKVGSDIEYLAKKGIYDAIENNQKNISDLLEAHFSKPSSKDMEQMLNTPWHGSFFSERLWGDTGKLANEVNDIIKKGITQGKTIAEMSFQLSNRLNKSMNYAHTLVRTETMNTLNRSSKDGYKKSGVKYVRWWAAQDERECDECGGNHGKLYPIESAPNLPCHTGCRCTWLPVLDDELNEYYRLIGSDGNSLYNYAKSDKIESVKNSDELKELFSYKDKFGRLKEAFNSSFDNLNFNTQKEVCEGILYMQEIYNIKSLPTISSNKMKEWGKLVVDQDGTLEIVLADKINKSVEEAFPTIIHELTHYINRTNSNLSDDIATKAKKSLKLTKKEYEKSVFELICSMDLQYLNNKSELLSYAIEREATNKGNPLSKEISRILRKELKK